MKTVLNTALGACAALALLCGAALVSAPASASERQATLGDGAPATLQQVRRRIWVAPAYDAYAYDPYYAGPAYYPPDVYYAPPAAYVPAPAYGYVPPVGYAYGPGPGVAVVGPRGGVYVGY